MTSGDGRPPAEWSEWELRAAEQLARRVNGQPEGRAWAEGRLCELAGERWRRDGSPLVMLEISPKGK